MVNKRKPQNTNTRMNFRASFSDINIEPKGTKPTMGPTSISEILTTVVLFYCKKILFVKIHYRVAAYFLCLFIISLITDVLPVPKVGVAKSESLINKYFVKIAWIWNLLFLIPFVTITTNIYCCGQYDKMLKQHGSRLVIATIFWWFWTSMFNKIEVMFGNCNVKYKSSDKLSTKESCLIEGYVWNGFDISGHTFILIYGSLFIIEETKCIFNWDSIKEHLRLETYRRSINDTTPNQNPLKDLNKEQLSTLQENYQKYTPYVKAIFFALTLLQVLWDFMLLITIVYYHNLVEKLLGGGIAMVTWYFTYRYWFKSTFLLPMLPGEGIFRYIKKETPNNFVPSGLKRNTGNSAETSVPMFMGRPIYTQTVTQAQEKVQDAERNNSVSASAR